MQASTQGLKFLANGIKVAETELANCEKAWEKEAKCCEHSQSGGDGLECSIYEHKDPFCYSTNCPLAK